METIPSIGDDQDQSNPNEDEIQCGDIPSSAGSMASVPAQTTSAANATATLRLIVHLLGACPVSKDTGEDLSSLLKIFLVQ